MIAANRAVLTAGVMIALALIPSAALIGMAAVSLNMQLGLQGLLRWTLEAALIIALSSAVFAWKRRRIHRRVMAS